MIVACFWDQVYRYQKAYTFKQQEKFKQFTKKVHCKYEKPIRSNISN